MIIKIDFSDNDYRLDVYYACREFLNQFPNSEICTSKVKDMGNSLRDVLFSLTVAQHFLRGNAYDSAYQYENYMDFHRFVDYLDKYFKVSIVESVGDYDNGETVYMNTENSLVLIR